MLGQEQQKRTCPGKPWCLVILYLWKWSEPVSPFPSVLGNSVVFCRQASLVSHPSIASVTCEPIHCHAALSADLLTSVQYMIYWAPLCHSFTDFCIVRLNWLIVGLLLNIETLAMVWNDFLCSPSVDSINAVTASVWMTSTAVLQLCLLITASTSCQSRFTNWAAVVFYSVSLLHVSLTLLYTHHGQLLAHLYALLSCKTVCYTSLCIVE